MNTDIIKSILEIQKVVNNSCYAKEAFRLVKANMKTPEKTTGLHNSKYITLESSISSINKAVRDAGCSIDIVTSFDSSSLTCKLEVTFGIKLKDTLHTCNYEHSISIPDSIDRMIVLKNSSHIMQGFGSYTTYMARYALRSFFFSLFDNLQDLDHVADGEKKTSKESNTDSASPFNIHKNESDSEDKIRLLSNFKERRNGKMTLRQCISFKPELVSLLDQALKASANDSSIKVRTPEISEEMYIDICTKAGHMVDLTNHIRKIIK